MIKHVFSILLVVQSMSSFAQQVDTVHHFKADKVLTAKQFNQLPTSFFCFENLNDTIMMFMGIGSEQGKLFLALKKGTQYRYWCILNGSSDNSLVYSYEFLPKFCDISSTEKWVVVDIERSYGRGVLHIDTHRQVWNLNTLTCCADIIVNKTTQQGPRKKYGEVIYLTPDTSYGQQNIKMFSATKFMVNGYTERAPLVNKDILTGINHPLRKGTYQFENGRFVFVE